MSLDRRADSLHVGRGRGRSAKGGSGPTHDAIAGPRGTGGGSAAALPRACGPRPVRRRYAESQGRRPDPAALQSAHAADPQRRLAIRGDERLTYGQVRAVCAEAQKIGFPGVALLVGERHHHDAGAGT